MLVALADGSMLSDKVIKSSPPRERAEEFARWHAHVRVDSAVDRLTVAKNTPVL